MTSQIFTNDELTNLIQERFANRCTGDRTKFTNQLARNLIKKLHDKDEKIRRNKGNNKRIVVAEVKDKESGNFNMKVIKTKIDCESESLSNSDYDAHSCLKKDIEKKQETYMMTGKEIVMTILNCKKISEEKKSIIDKEVASNFTSSIKLQLAKKLKKSL